MDEHQRMVADKLTVAELVTTQLVAFPPLVRLRELALTLRRCKQKAFPVTTEVDAAYQSGELKPWQQHQHAGLRVCSIASIVTRI